MEDLIREFLERGQYSAPGEPTGLFNVENTANFIAESIKGAAKILWVSLVEGMGYVCIVAAVAGIFLYVFGYKKGIRITGGSIGIYCLLKLLGVAFGV